MMSKYMQVVWLYLIGIAIIFFGIIMLSMKSGPNSFIVMLMGLAVSALGAAHGRRMKMLGQLDLEKIMKDKDAEGGKKVAGKEKNAHEEAQDEKEGQEAGTEDAGREKKSPGMDIGSRIGKVMDAFRKGPQGPEINEEAIDGIEMEDMKRGKIAAISADVVELVCPKCMAENDDKNVFCFKCGNRLRRKAAKEGDEDRPDIAVEPGTITVVGDRKIAKVVICPKCNIANKVGDKYCWNCGKKIRSDSVVALSRIPKASRGIPEVDAIFSEPVKKARKGRRGVKRQKSNLKNAEQIKS